MKNKLRIIFNHSSIIVSLVLVILISFISVGYAFYSAELSSIGIISLDVTSNIDCIATSLTNGDNKNTTYIDSSYTNQEYHNKSIIKSKVYGTFNSGSGDYMTMVINIKNVSSQPQTFTEFASSSSLDSDGNFLPQPRLLNIVIGDVLEPHESRDISVIYYYKNSISNQKSFEAEYTFIFEDGRVNVTVPTMMGTIDKNVFDVKDEVVSSSVNIVNAFDVSVKYYLRLSNNDGIVTLVDGSNKVSSYSSILDAGENENKPIYFKVDFGTNASVSTMLYIETENGEIYDIQELTFNNNNKPQSIIPINIIVEASNKWQGSSYSLWLEADNSANDTPVTDFSIVVKFKDGCALKSFQYYGTGVGKWNNSTLTYTINGIDQWNTREHLSIPENTTQRFGIFKMDFYDELETIYDYIDYVVVLNEIEDPGDSEAECSYNEDNEFVCSPGQ